MNSYICRTNGQHMESPFTVDGFPRYWKRLRFDQETDVREDFITPLLWTLGYRKGTVADILREQYYDVHPKLWHKGGSRKIKIDYRPTVCLKGFWIIEAKNGGDGQILTEEDLQQAYFYAMHPNVRARFIVLTNGVEIRLYDSYPLPQLEQNDALYDNYILICRQSDCETNFRDLYRFLGAKTMLASIQEYVTSTLADTLEAELDEDAPERLKRRLFFMLEGSKERIRANMRREEMAAWRTYREESQQSITSCSDHELVIHLTIQTNPSPQYGPEVLRRINDASTGGRDWTTEHGSLIDELAQHYRGRPHNVFRMHCVNILAHLAMNRIEIPRTAWSASTMDTLNMVVADNMSYCVGNPLQHALAHLDNTTLRIAKKYCARFDAEPIRDTLTKTKAAMPAQEWVRNVYRFSALMLHHTQQLADVLWGRYAYLSNPDDIWAAIWGLEALEREIERIPPAPTEPDERDVLSLEWYGRTLDMLVMGTHGLLSRCREALVDVEASSFVVDVAKRSREDIVAALPKPERPPDGFDMAPDEWLSVVITNVRQIVDDILGQTVGQNVTDVGRSDSR